MAYIFPTSHLHKRWESLVADFGEERGITLFSEFCEGTRGLVPIRPDTRIQHFDEGLRGDFYFLGRWLWRELGKDEKSAGGIIADIGVGVAHRSDEVGNDGLLVLDVAENLRGKGALLAVGRVVKDVFQVGEVGVRKDNKAQLNCTNVRIVIQCVALGIVFGKVAFQNRFVECSVKITAST